MWTINKGKKIKVNKKCVQEKEKWNKFLLWLKTWKTVIISVIAISLTMGAFIAIKIFVFKGQTSKSNPRLHVTDSSNILHLNTDSGGCRMDNCEIYCKSVTESEMLNQLEAFDVSMCERILKLTLEEVSLPKTLEKGWLMALPYDVNSLTLRYNEIQSFSLGAFSGTPFISLNELILEDIPIAFLEKDTFFEATIQIFAFRYNTYNWNLKVEENLFEQVASKIQSVQFSKSIGDSEVLLNITGPDVNFLTALTELDLRANVIGHLPANSFLKTKKLISLYLGDSALSSIDVRAFNGLTSLRKLDLQGNQLEILPENVFEHFQHQSLKIGIDSNNFICNCSMIWFKLFFAAHKSDYFVDTNFLCFDHDQLDYSKVDFGDCGTTVTTDSTSTSTSIVTIPDDYENTTIITCDLAFDKDFSWGNFELVSKFSINLGHVLLYQQYNDLELSYIIEIEQFQDFHFIYSTIPGDLQCLTNITSKIYLPNLNHLETYTICLQDKKLIKTNVLDCFSFTTPPEYPDRPFLKNKDMTMFIGIIVLVIFIIIAITVIAVFLIVRKYPKLLKHNERVIFVNKNGVDVMLLPVNRKFKSDPFTITIASKSMNFILEKNRISISSNKETFEIFIKGHNFQNIFHLDQKDYEIPTLEAGETYTVCLGNKINQYQASPFDCTGLKMEDPWEEKTLFSAKFKWTIIGVSIFISIFIIFTTIFITYCAIYRKPEIIKGNKKVLVVKNWEEEHKLSKIYDLYGYSGLGAASASYLTPKTYIPYYAKTTASRIYDYPKIFVLSQDVDRRRELEERENEYDRENIYTSCI